MREDIALAKDSPYALEEVVVALLLDRRSPSWRDATPADSVDWGHDVAHIITLDIKAREDPASAAFNAVHRHYATSDGSNYGMW